MKTKPVKTWVGYNHPHTESPVEGAPSSDNHNEIARLAFEMMSVSELLAKKEKTPTSKVGVSV